MTDSAYLAVALAVFIVAAAIQVTLYLALLRPALSAADIPRSRRWLAGALGWQAVVLIASAAYVFGRASSHPSGLAWIAPALAALLGTALPLQVAVGAVLRAARR